MTSPAYNDVVGTSETHPMLGNADIYYQITFFNASNMGGYSFSYNGAEKGTYLYNDNGVIAEKSYTSESPSPVVLNPIQDFTFENPSINFSVSPNIEVCPIGFILSPKSVSNNDIYFYPSLIEVTMNNIVGAQYAGSSSRAVVALVDSGADPTTLTASQVRFGVFTVGNMVYFAVNGVVVNSGNTDWGLETRLLTPIYYGGLEIPIERDWSLAYLLGMDVACQMYSNPPNIYDVDTKNCDLVVYGVTAGVWSYNVMGFSVTSVTSNPLWQNYNRTTEITI